MSTKITIEHTIEELNSIILALAKRPFDEVHELINKLRSEGQKQISESQANAQPLETSPVSEPESHSGD